MRESLSLFVAWAALASAAVAQAPQPHERSRHGQNAQLQRELAHSPVAAPLSVEVEGRPAASATPTPQPSGGQLSGAAVGYPVTYDVSDVLAVDWRVDTQEERVFVRLRHEGADDWFAQCWNVNPHMIGGDCLLFQPSKVVGGDAKAGVSCVTLSQTSTVGIHAIPPSQWAVSNVAAAVSQGVVTITYDRPLAAGGYTGAIAIPVAGNIYVTASQGNGGQASVQRHRLQDAHVGMVDMASGTASFSAASLTAVQVAHGVCMALACGVLVPVAVGVMRYRGNVGTSHARALRLHWLLQMVAVVCALGGLILAVVSVPAGAHFSSAHQIVGMLTLVLTAEQALAGVLRPGGSASTVMPGLSCSRRLWRWLHKAAGWTAVVCMMASIFLGLVHIGAHVGWIITYAAMLVVAACACAWFEAGGSCATAAVKVTASGSPDSNASVTPPNPSQQKSSPTADDTGNAAGVNLQHTRVSFEPQVRLPPSPEENDDSTPSAPALAGNDASVAATASGAAAAAHEPMQPGRSGDANTVSPDSASMHTIAV